MKSLTLLAIGILFSFSAHAGGSLWVCYKPGADLSVPEDVIVWQAVFAGEPLSVPNGKATLVKLNGIKMNDQIDLIETDHGQRIDMKGDLSAYNYIGRIETVGSSFVNFYLYKKSASIEMLKCFQR